MAHIKATWNLFSRATKLSTINFEHSSHHAATRQNGRTRAQTHSEFQSFQLSLILEGISDHNMTLFGLKGYSLFKGLCLRDFGSLGEFELFQYS